MGEGGGGGVWGIAGGGTAGDGELGGGLAVLLWFSLGFFGVRRLLCRF